MLPPVALLLMTVSTARGYFARVYERWWHC